MKQKQRRTEFYGVKGLAGQHVILGLGGVAPCRRRFFVCDWRWMWLKKNGFVAEGLFDECEKKKKTRISRWGRASIRSMRDSHFSPGKMHFDLKQYGILELQELHLAREGAYRICPTHKLLFYRSSHVCSAIGSSHSGLACKWAL